MRQKKKLNEGNFNSGEIKARGDAMLVSVGAGVRARIYFCVCVCVFCESVGGCLGTFATQSMSHFARHPYPSGPLFWGSGERDSFMREQGLRERDLNYLSLDKPAKEALCFGETFWVHWHSGTLAHWSIPSSVPSHSNFC